MKKLLWGASLALLFSSLLPAVPVNCAPTGSNAIVVGGAVTSATFTCLPSALANNQAGDSVSVQAVVLRVSVAVQSTFGAGGIFQSVIASTVNGIGLSNPGPVACGGVTAFDGSLNAAADGTSITAIPCVDVVNPFSVTVTGTPNGGSALPQFALATVEYDTITCAPVLLPEPSSWALLGSALLAGGFTAKARRRRRKAAQSSNC